MATGQGGAEIAFDQAPTLNCNHEAPIVAPGGAFVDAREKSTLELEYERRGLEYPSVTHALKGEGHDASEDGTGRGVPLVPALAPTLDARSVRSGYNDFALSGGLVPENVPTLTSNGDAHSGFKGADGLVATCIPINTQMGLRRPDTSNRTSEGIGIGKEGDPAFTLQAAHGHAVAIVEPITLAIRGRGDGHELEYRQDCTANALMTPNGGRGGVGVGVMAHGMAVRRLIPRECERLQGMDDDWTLVPVGNRMMADGPRYKMCGNGFARPVVEWIFGRIEAVRG